MIASQNSAVEISGTMTGKVVKMGMDPNSLVHLQSIYINMYGDPEMAMIREIACNGRDATIEYVQQMAEEHGVEIETRPIEVVTPSEMSPFLTIRDFGCGLDEDALENLYSQYGASTKRGTNDQTGCLGIGSKSPLAYTPQFTVSSVKDGMKIQMMVGLDEDGAGQLTMIEDEDGRVAVETDEDNGTAVIIPAKRYNAIARKARELFSYWPEGSVLVDGKPVDPVDGMIMTDKPHDVAVQIEDSDPRVVRIEKMILRKGEGQSVIVMGGVPYPVPSEHNSFNLGHSNSIVAWVGMAEVEFAPNREALRFTTATKQAVKAIHEHFDAQAVKALQVEINGAKRPVDALRILMKWGNIVPERIVQEHKFTYQGKLLPARFEMPKPKDGEAQEQMIVIGQRPNKLSQHSRHPTIVAETAINAVWFYNYDRPTFTAGQRKKINHWTTQIWPSFPYGEGVPSHFIMVKGKPDTTFLDTDKLFDWSIIQAIRLPRTSGGYTGPTGRIPGSYDLFENGEYRQGVPGDEINTDNPIYYMTKWRGHERWEMEPTAKAIAHFEDATIVILTSNRTEKFLRLFPDTIKADARLQEIREEWKESIPDTTLELLAFKEACSINEFEILRPHRPFVDADIEATFDLIDKLDDSALTEAEKERKLLRVSIDHETTWEDPLTTEKFPLVMSYYGSLERKNIEHVVLYLNAVATAAVTDNDQAEA